MFPMFWSFHYSFISVYCPTINTAYVRLLVRHSPQVPTYDHLYEADRPLARKCRKETQAAPTYMGKGSNLQ